jgi:ankyrin repeat protein
MASLHKAVLKGDEKKVRELLNKPRMRRHIDFWKRVDGLLMSPLLAAENNFDITKLPLDHGADANARDFEGKSPFAVADHKGIQRLLGAKGGVP